MAIVVEKSGQSITEPITLADAKLHLRVDHCDDDPLITSLITTARQACENEARRSFVSRSFYYIDDAFPYGNSLPGLESQASGYVIPGGVSAVYPRRGVIHLPMGPLKETSGITSIIYYDTNGVQQTLDSSQYVVDPYSVEPRIEPEFNCTWPLTRVRINAVQIEFIAGFDVMPGPVRAAALLWLGALYENRQAAVQGAQVPELPKPISVSYLLAQYRVIQ